MQNDLENSFKKFNLIKFDGKTTVRKAAVENRLSIPVGGKEVELLLTPRDLRSTRYQAENTGVGGVDRLGRDEITTFEGTVAGDGDSQVRVSINGSRMEGYFITGGEMLVVEPARKFSSAAGAADYVVYRAADLINQESSFCKTSVGEKINQGMEMLAASGAQSPQVSSVVEMATEADFEFVNALGGAGQANSEILAILNMVEGVYERELNLKISVVYQHTWTTQDPFVATDSLAALNSFRDYWNVNFPVAQKPRDAAHLFSGKPAITGQGLAYIGVVCKSPSSAYSLTGRINVAPTKFMLTAHEVGHNFGGRHAEALQTSENTVMNAILTPATLFTFSTYSRTEITIFVSANNGCLTAQTTKTKFDFDGDGKSDIGVYRPSEGNWYVSPSARGGYFATQFGNSTDLPVAADYDGDGKTDVAVYRPSDGNWYVSPSSRGGYFATQFGNSTDVPVAADYDGDGKTDIAVYRPSEGNWYVSPSARGGYFATQFGNSTDLPVAADYDGDGKTDIAVYRPSEGNWYVSPSSRGGYFATQFGARGDKPTSSSFIR